MSWRRIYLGISALLVGATVVYAYLPEFSQKYRILGPFSLGMENNLAVWWSGASLLTAALLAFELSFSRNLTRHAWSALAFVLFGLACDEIGSVHERLGGWRAYIPIAIPLVVLLAFVFYRLTSNAQSRPSTPGLLLGFASFGLVAFMEWLEAALVWSASLEPLRLGFEEGLELLGEFLILHALVRERMTQPPEQRFRALVPRPQHMSYLMPLLVVGLVAHAAVCTWVVPEIHDDRGDFGSLFPTFTYFLLFAAAFWRHLEGPPARRGAWRALAIFLVACSAGQVYDLSRLVPRVTAVVPQWALSDPYVLTAVQLAVVLLLWRGRRDMLANRPRVRHGLGVALLVAGLVVAGHDPGLAIRGALPYLLAVLFL